MAAAADAGFLDDVEGAADAAAAADGDNEEKSDDGEAISFVIHSL